MAEWYVNEGKDNDVVLSTKACIVRNIKGYNFLFLWISTESVTHFLILILKETHSLRRMNI